MEGVNETEFKDLMTEWVEIADQLKKSQGHIKKLKNRKSEISKVIQTFMRNAEVDTCNLNDGKVLLRNSKKTQPLTRAHILKSLVDFLENEEQANNATAYIFESREVNQQASLKRTHKRNEE